MYGRKGEKLYPHGSAASRMLAELEIGIPACITVALVGSLGSRGISGGGAPYAESRGLFKCYGSGT